MVKIIAEVAQGYEGKPEYCDLYVRAAAKAGADAVKFQIVYADDVAEPGYEYYNWFKQLEMDVSVWTKMRETAKTLGIKVFCDVSGERAFEIAKQANLDGIKIHSSNFFNRTLLKEAFVLVPQVFVSLGGAKEDEVDALVAQVKAWGYADKMTLLYGFQSEPTPIEMSNVARLSYLKERYAPIPVGYLDHLDGTFPEPSAISAMAIALGTDWIEKHMTISRHMEVEDYVSALEFDEFSAYVQTVKALTMAVGEKNFTLCEAELKYRDKAIKKILARRSLKSGDVLQYDDFLLKRTAKIEPFAGVHNPELLVGKKLTIDIDAEEPILAEYVA